MRIIRRGITRLSVAAALLAAASPVQAQIGVPGANARVFEPRFGIGYVVNMPNQYAGASVHVLTEFLGGFGVYVDAKFDVSSPEDEQGYVDSLTAAEVDDRIGDQLFHSDASWKSVNVAIMRSVGPQFAVYAGGGIANGAQYREYLDDTGQMGLSGFYWVRDPESSGTEVNLLFGGMFQLTRAFGFQVGFETQPRGIALGVNYLVPMRR
jgi:hypothetical protein